MSSFCKILFASLLTFFCSLKINAQKTGVNDTIKVAAWISPQGDTLPFQILPRIEVVTVRKLTAQQRRQKEEWTRLRNAVYVTYPYARASGKIMNEINAKLVGITDKKQRKAIIKAREKELRKEFANKISDLSIYQGKVMMKLIYRETGNSCYEIISEYKGGFTATFYQTIALIVGTNLKQVYDKNGVDNELEKIVQDVERMYGYRI